MLGEPLDEPAEHAGGVRVGDRQHAHATGLSCGDERVEAGLERWVAEAVTGVDHHRGRARLADRRDGVADDLAAADVVAVRRQVRQADRAHAVGLGVADAAGSGVGLQRRRT